MIQYVNIRFLQIITVCHLKTLRDIEKLTTHLNPEYKILSSSPTLVLVAEKIFFL
jgi:hypothetical protein